MIVKDGKANAQIVIASENRPRMATLAALELQYYIQKISGAKLPIVTAVDTNVPVKIYVGKSLETDKLGIKTDDLKYGAYRIASGDNWIVLLGADFDFIPPQPMPKDRKDMPRANAEWDELIKDKTEMGWGFPFASQWKFHWEPKDLQNIISSRYGEDALPIWKGASDSLKGFWKQDEGGTANAVYAFLRNLGVRWFMPSDLGEVIPEMQTISVKPINETVNPAYAVRDWNYYNYSGFSYDDVMYSRRCGMNSGYEKIGNVHGPHGLTMVTSTDAMKKAHPEYYALISGKHDTEHRGSGTACFSSEGLMEETAKYIRFMYDKYDLPLIDIWPADGMKVCQCEKCKGKTPSELVWGFADKVAREVYNTHPQKFVSCGAYTPYREAPDNIVKFSPNLVVQISNRGRALMSDTEHWVKYQEQIKQWSDRIAPGNIMRLENSRYFLGGEGDRIIPIVYPVIHPRGIARDLKYLKGISFGDTGEQSQAQSRWVAPGLNHINLYVQSQFLWDPDQNVDAVLDDYYKSFYGPAASQIKEAFDYAEDNLAFKDTSRPGGRANPKNVSLEVSLKFRELIDKARQVAGDTVYGKRIDLIISELIPKDELIAKNKEDNSDYVKFRAKAPLATGHEGADLSSAKSYNLKDNKTGETPAVETSFKAGWDKNALLLEITCKEPHMDKLPVSPQVHGGDYVAISLETTKHSYYHIEVNPDGAIVEGMPASKWKSLADVKTERGADFWRLRLSIPVVGDEDAAADPNHKVHGDKPTAKNPWYFNVGRYRKLDEKNAELQAFSPTKRTLHQPKMFGRLEINAH